MNERREMIAAVAYRANQTYCELNDMQYPPWSWEELSSEERQMRVDAVGLAMLSGEKDPKAQHDKWRQAKVDAGWTFGPVIDYGKREHPNLVAYDHLPDRVKLQDALFLAIVHALK